ncbi:MAG: diguanylate cyclase [Methylococcales bacterium]|nr:diguanylate cyclase [Methylococcales bacterium]
MKFRSVNQKLIISVLLVALVLAIFVSIVSFISELERSSSQTEVMLNQLLDTVEDTASIALFSRNDQIALDVLKGLLKNDIVYKAQIKGDEGFDFQLSKDYVTNNIEKVILRPLISPFGDEELGYLLVQPAAQFKLIEAKHGAITNAISSVLIIIVTSITIFLIIRSNISKPLTYVSDTLHAIQIGHKQRISELKKNKNDELGRLVLDINDLLGVLDDKYKNELALRKKVESIEQQLRSIFNSTSAGLFALDENGVLITFNKTFQHILKNVIADISTPNSLLASCFHEQEEFNNLIVDAFQSGQLETQDFSLLATKDAGLTWVHCLLSKVINESGKVHIEGVIFDVTERVKVEKSITYEANHDMLTGLLRRQATQQAYQQHLKVSTNFKACFLFLDLDGFKEVNDTYGHRTGDKVLVIATERLIDCVRETDLVCRIGGDEFLIILINCSNTNTYQIAKNIIMSIQKKIPISNGISIGVSMGIAHLTENAKGFDELVQAADTAMYEVKRQGKNGYCVSNEEKKVHKISNKI